VYPYKFSAWSDCASRGEINDKRAGVFVEQMSIMSHLENLLDILCLTAEGNESKELSSEGREMKFDGVAGHAAGYLYPSLDGITHIGLEVTRPNINEPHSSPSLRLRGHSLCAQA
jgi:hypothetical protein